MEEEVIAAEEIANITNQQQIVPIRNNNDRQEDCLVRQLKMI